MKVASWLKVPFAIGALFTASFAAGATVTYFSYNKVSVSASSLPFTHADQKSIWEPYWWTMPISGAQVERERCRATLVRVEVPSDVAVECAMRNVTASRAGSFYAYVYTSDPSAVSSPSFLYYQTMGTTASPGTMTIPYAKGYGYGKTYWVRIHYEPAYTSVGSKYTATFDLAFSRKDGSGFGGGGSDVPQPTLSDISIEGSSELFPGSYTNYTCWATMSDGCTKQVNATWSIASAPAKRANINASTGRLESNKWSDLTSPVNIVIQASYTEGGVTKTATKAVTILVPLQTIVVRGGDSVHAGGTKTYACIATMADGTTKQVEAKWGIDSGPSYGSISPEGVLTAKSTASGKEIVIKASYTEGAITCILKKPVSILDPAPSVIISFDANGGSLDDDSQRFTEGDEYGPLPTPTRDGHTFGGWYTSSSFEKKITASSVVESSVACLYAKWTANTHSVSYNYNGGNPGSLHPSSATFGTAFRVSAPNKSGSAFAGWTVESGLASSTAAWGTSSSPSTPIPDSSTKCANGAAGDVWFRNLSATPDGRVTLAANWEKAPETYTVTYKRGANGTGEQKTDTKAKGVALTLQGAIFRRNGYEQKGWATSDGGGKVYDLSAPYTANASVTLYPYWEPELLTVTFFTYGGTPCPDRQYAYDSTFGTLPSTTKTGYVFDGWYESLSYATRVTEDSRVHLVELYAKWTPITYAISYDYDGGTKGENNPPSATYDLSFRVSAPTRSEFTFDGWTVTRGLDPSTATWGTSWGRSYAVTSSGTKCSNGATGDVFFENLRNTEGSVTLKANWKPVGPIWLYTVINEGATVMGADPATGAITLPSFLSGYPVTGIGDSAFENCGGLTHVTIPDSVTSIGERAFFGCSGMTEMTIPRNDTGIGENAFSGCSGLKTLYVPMAWEGTTNLAKAGVPDGCTVVYSEATQTVTFEANEGSCATKTNVYGMGGKYDPLPAATRTEYDFAGWWTAAGGGEQVTTNTTVTTNRTRTLWAHWTETPKPNLRGYKPLAWPAAIYLAEDWGSTNTTTNVWAEETVHLNFCYGNFGEGAANSHRVAGAVLDVEGNAVTNWNWKEGRIRAGACLGVTNIAFSVESAGWYTVVITLDSLGSLAELDESDNEMRLAFTASAPQTVTFEANGGTCSTKTNVYAVGGKYDFLPTASLAGHDFAGWWTAAVGGEQVSEDTSVTTNRARTLWAHWKETPKPNLKAYKPVAWPAALYLATAWGSTNTTTNVWMGETVHLNFCYGNFGKEPANSHRVAGAVLDAAGNAVTNWNWKEGRLGTNACRGVTNIAFSVAAPGRYTVVVTLDSLDSLDELDESDNVMLLTFTAAPQRGSYHDPDSAFWDVEFGEPGAALGHGAYAAAVVGTAIGCTTNASTGAKTWRVPGSEDPGILQRAVDQARAGDTIQVAPGCYDPITVGKDRISIVSREGRMQTFINGKYAARCVDFGSTKGGIITGFTLVQGNAGEGDGGGIRGGSASYCLIEGCRAAHGGGAALSALSDCFVTWNTAGASGGGAYGGSLLRCEVRHNEAAIGGGAVATTATGTLFAGNEATTKAGGAEQSTLMACTVADNRAKSAAGVSGCTVKNSLLHGNRLRSGATNNYVSSTCQYTCAWPIPAGTGNFNADPNFVKGDENYHLNNYSKCRDKANKNLSKTPYDLAGLDRAMGSNADAGACEYATGVTPLDAADYDGDGLPDVGFFNPVNGTWFVKRTSDGTVWRLPLGDSGSKLVPRDYDGDGVRDPAVYDSNTGTWKIRLSGTGSVVTKKLGWKGITAVDAADFDGDGKADPIIFNPASTTWQILQSRNGATAVVKNFGTTGVKLFCGDYDGDGYGDLAYYVAKNYRWYVRFHGGGTTWVTLGASGVRPCPVDLDMDGALDAGYFDPATGKWTVRSFATRATTTVKFGDKTTTPHPYDWNNDGIPDTLGLYSPYRAGFLDLYKNADGTTTAFTINF